MVFVESLGQLFYVRVPDYVEHVPVGHEASFSVRADLMHTGDNLEMANRIEASYITTEFLGTLETDVFEVAPGQYVNIEQHRHLSDSSYEMGEKEMICWAADSGVLLNENITRDSVGAA